MVEGVLLRTCCLYSCFDIFCAFSIFKVHHEAIFLEMRKAGSSRFSLSSTLNTRTELISLGEIQLLQDFHIAHKSCPMHSGQERFTLPLIDIYDPICKQHALGSISLTMASTLTVSLVLVDSVSSRQHLAIARFRPRSSSYNGSRGGRPFFTTAVDNICLWRCNGDIA